MNEPKKKRKSLFDALLKDTEEKKKTEGKSDEPKKPGWLESLILNPPPPATVTKPPCCKEPNDDDFFWAMHNVPVRAASRHLLIVGEPGSGKSVTIELFLRSIAHRVAKTVLDRPPERMLLLDVKSTYIGFLTSIGVPKEKIIIANPFHRDTKPWRIAKDIKGEAAAVKLAAILVPAEEKASTTYFWQSSRLIIGAVILALSKVKPDAWTLRDLVLALSSPERIQRTAANDPASAATVGVFFNDKDHAPAIMTSIITRMQRFRTVAALWHATKVPPEEQFSITDWLNGDGVMLLGHPPKYLESINPINAMILRLVCDELQSRADVSAPHTWIVLDEFRWMKEVECMAELLGLGRSKGASILLGIQDFSGMKDAFGADRADEILGLCENKSFLKVGNATTAEWASKYFADRERTETKWSWTTSKDGTSTTRSDDIVTRPVYLPGEFLDLVKPENIPGFRFEGIHDVPLVGGAFSTDEHAPDIFALNPRPTDDHLRLFKNHDDQDLDAQTLVDWTPEEENQILAPAPKKTKSKEPNKKPNKKSAETEKQKQKEADIQAALNKIL
jgi:hypothetical protein